MTENAHPEDTLLALFRSEVAYHTTVLEKGLQTLIHNPEALEQLEIMQQEVHAIWGGARIVELDEVAKMAQAVKNSLLAMQTGKVVLTSTRINLLSQIIALFYQFSETELEQIPTWNLEHQSDMEDLVLTINQIVNEKPTVEANLPKPPEQPNPDSPSPPNSIPNSVEYAITAPSSTNTDHSHIIADPTLIGLFLTEVETHVVSLNEGLLALEIDPKAVDQLEALMRAAHSIKGAARVVGLEKAIKIAHLLEDCFVAAQQGELTLVADHIDILLRSVDMLTHIAQTAHLGHWEQLSQLDTEIESLVIALASVLKGETPSLPISDTKSNRLAATINNSISSAQPASLAQSPLESGTASFVLPAHSELKSLPSQKTTEQDRMVRVTAAKIERLMGLAGEIVVSARWLSPFSESLLALKKSHIELAGILEKLQETSEQTTVEERTLKWVKKARAKIKECNLSLAEKLNQLDIFTSHTTTHSDRLYHEVIGVRMRPFADGIQGYPRMVRDLAKELGKKVRFEIIGKSTEVDQDIQERLEAPLNHLLRNALDHGIEFPKERLAAGKPETGYLRLEVGHRAGMLMITIADDGHGVELDKLRHKIAQKGLASDEIIAKLTETELMEFLFLPGFSTTDNVTEISGRGVGLDVVHNMVHEVGGVVRAVSIPGKGMSFHLELPLTLSVVRTFLVEIAGEPFAFPLARIARCLELSKTDIEWVEDRQYFRFDNTNIALIDIHDVLEKAESIHQPSKLAVVVISDRLNAYGLVVDKFLGEYDLVVRPLDPRLGKVPNISAAAIMLDGSPVLIFDIDDLIRSIDNLLTGKRLRKINEFAEPDQKRRKRVLVVDDSITVREMERKILENSGYEVEVAVDGMEGWNAVRIAPFDLIVSDVDMPRMNGIELINHIKQHEEFKLIPIIIVSYKDTKTHRLQGLEAGANYYLTKSSFEDNSFIEAVVDLIGAA